MYDADVIIQDFPLQSGKLANYILGEHLLSLAGEL
jgi:hypothetical protein